VESANYGEKRLLKTAITRFHTCNTAVELSLLST